MSIIVINILILSLCILFQGFFSGAEMVILSSNKTKIRHMARRGHKGAVRFLKIVETPEWSLATTSTGTNLFVIISSVFTAVWFENIFKENSEIWSILIITPFLLILGEILPRTIFQQKADDLALKIALPFKYISRIILPVTYLVFYTSRFFYNLIKKDSASQNLYISKKELELVLSINEKESDLEIGEKKLIKRVFHLFESNVSDVMVPLVNVTAISSKATVGKAINAINETGYSRLPVYKSRIDNLIGIIHPIDLIHIKDIDAAINPFIREVPYVPESTKAHDLLTLLQRTRNSIAIVLDEYGGTVGIITIEDILEEVVGEINDEYDDDKKQFIRFEENKFLVNARMEIENANEIMNIDIPKEDYETIGGFLLKLMGKIPKKGETVIYKDIKFTVRSSGKKSIHSIIVEIVDKRHKGPETAE
ncbi:hemolysin family protein [Desulfobacterium sp. N47]|uniref:hemolysin family protein n=1 Tax=Desulfobacterium sp. N47 TaxID=3115210 RepID=UPI003F4A1650